MPKIQSKPVENQVGLAETIAHTFHKGQKRKMGDDKGKPYVVHPERVAAKFGNEILRAAAWMHDVVEDTHLTVMDLINMGVSLEVANLVRLVTHEKGEEYYQYIARVKQNRDATLIKLADIDDNLQSLHKGSMRDKYLLAQHYLRAETYSGWIRVEDCLPQIPADKYAITVLAILRDDVYEELVGRADPQVVTLSWDGKKWHDAALCCKDNSCTWVEVGDRVTHWMYEPALPGKDD